MREIRSAVWRPWEDFDVPHSPVEVIEAMEALPPSALLVERRFVRAPIVLQQVVGKVFGARFRILGVRDQAGRWVSVWAVTPA